MDEFIVKTTVQVYSTKDWKFRVETTIKFEVETTDDVHSAKDWKFEVEKIEENKKNSSYLLNFQGKDIWKTKKD